MGPFQISHLLEGSPGTIIAQPPILQSWWHLTTLTNQLVIATTVWVYLNIQLVFNSIWWIFSPQTIIFSSIFDRNIKYQLSGGISKNQFEVDQTPISSYVLRFHFLLTQFTLRVWKLCNNIGNADWTVGKIRNLTPSPVPSHHAKIPSVANNKQQIVQFELLEMMCR